MSNPGLPGPGQRRRGCHHQRRPGLADIIRANPEWGVHIVGKPFTDEYYGIAVAKDKPEVLAAINAGLATVRATGQYDQIYNQWFGSTGIPDRVSDRRWW